MTSSTTDSNEMAQIQKRSTILLAILAAIAFAFATAPAYSQATITAGFANHHTHHSTQNNFASNANTITIEKDVWSLTLPNR